MHGNVSPTVTRPTACPRRRHRTAVSAGLFVAVLAVLAVGCGAGGGSDRPGDTRDGDGDQTRAARPTEELWVDPETPAARQVAQWERAGRARDAALLRRIAERPVAAWPSGEISPGPEVKRVVTAATAEDRTAVLVAYNIPHRDCGQYSQGGASDVTAYRRWISAFANAVDDAHAIVILEPDAVPHTLDGCAAGQYVTERYHLLSEAADRFTSQPNTRVYLDAGNPSWVTDTGRLADALRRSGVERADGFALNVANFQRLESNIAYGRQLSKMLNGAHFVIDTSRNGDGPYENGDGGPPPGEESAAEGVEAGRAGEAWCNPPGRALGKPPTTDTGDPLVDAFLWIKRPGESDGECRGGPPAGQWWPDYALELARGATTHE